MAKSAVRKPESATTEKLKKLFDERDATKPGSEEEKRAAEKILETIFPDTDVR